MTQEALKLALEALQKIYIAPEHEEYIRVWWPTCEQAITAIKEALREHAMREVQRLGQEIEQEPVAYINVEKRRLEFAEPMVWHTPTVVNLERIPLYTHQRTWVGLTPQQRDEINERVYGAVPHHVAFHHAIEAKLKELNS